MNRQSWQIECVWKTSFHKSGHNWWRKQIITDICYSGRLVARAVGYLKCLSDGVLAIGGSEKWSRMTGW